MPTPHKSCATSLRVPSTGSQPPTHWSSLTSWPSTSTGRYLGNTYSMFSCHAQVQHSKCNTLRLVQTLTSATTKPCDFFYRSWGEAHPLQLLHIPSNHPALPSQPKVHRCRPHNQKRKKNHYIVINCLQVCVNKEFHIKIFLNSICNVTNEVPLTFLETLSCTTLFLHTSHIYIPFFAESQSISAQGSLAQWTKASGTPPWAAWR